MENSNINAACRYQTLLHRTLKFEELMFWFGQNTKHYTKRCCRTGSKSNYLKFSFAKIMKEFILLGIFKRCIEDMSGLWLWWENGIYELRLEEGRDRSCMYDCMNVFYYSMLAFSWWFWILMVLMVDTNEPSLGVIIAIHILNKWWRLI